MAIVERLEDFKQSERPRSSRHKRAKDGGDGRSKSGLPNATDDEWSRDKGHCHHHKEEKKHKGSRKRDDSCDHKAHVGPRGGCFYCAGPHYKMDCPHKGKMIAFLEKHKCSKGNSSNSNGETRMGALLMEPNPITRPERTSVPIRKLEVAVVVEEEVVEEAMVVVEMEVKGIKENTGKEAVEEEEEVVVVAVGKEVEVEEEEVKVEVMDGEGEVVEVGEVGVVVVVVEEEEEEAEAEEAEEEGEVVGKVEVGDGEVEVAEGEVATRVTVGLGVVLHHYVNEGHIFAITKVALPYLDVSLKLLCMYLCKFSSGIAGSFRDFSHTNFLYLNDGELEW
ncbi:hypothetical protein RJ640_000377 [Escallonia rubra]|uniref:Uncharacterized protein n=1 Tax=Escallonia rubra TaxID=112253 RepID=A0AA88RT82_9ASTE|nr:hypothetical protein RJ640_000377 [Escallonia rubra]